jgi:hypothetical protein
VHPITAAWHSWVDWQINACQHSTCSACRLHSNLHFSGLHAINTDMPFDDARVLRACGTSSTSMQRLTSIDESQFFIPNSMPCLRTEQAHYVLRTRLAKSPWLKEAAQPGEPGLLSFECSCQRISKQAANIQASICSILHHWHSNFESKTSVMVFQSSSQCC